MLRFFQGKNGGVISIMLALMMVAVLGVSSVLVELGRFQSSSAILDEATESSGFSAIANKNKTLLKNYGLLAIDSSTDLSDMAKKYLQSNLGGAESSTFNVEYLLKQIDEVAAEGIYSLNESAVLKRQILEVTKYRGAITLLEDTINIDGILSSISEAFSGISAISKFVNKASDTISKLSEFVNSIKELLTSINDLNDSRETYSVSYQNLKDAINKRDNLADAQDIMSPPKNPEKEKDDDKYKDENGVFDQDKFDDALEEYENKRDEYEKWEKKNKELKDVMQSIDGTKGEKGLKQEYIDAAKDCQDKYNAFKSASTSMRTDFKNLLSSGLDTVYQKLINNVNASDDDKEKKEELVAEYKATQSAIKDSYDDINDKISKYSDEINNLQEKCVEVDVSNVVAYLESVDSSNIDLTTLNNKHKSVKLLLLVDNIIQELKSDVINSILTKIVMFVETLIETVGKLVQALSYSLGTGVYCDIEYDVTINDDTWNTIKTNHSSAKSSISSHDTEDKALADKKREVAGGTKTDTDSFVEKLYVEINNMQDGIQEITDAANVVKDEQVEDGTVLDKIKNIINSTIIGKIYSVSRIIGNLGSFIDGIKKTVGAAMKIATIVLSNLTDIIYDSILINTYATKMFRNRTSLDKDTTMLGVSYSDIDRGTPNSHLTNAVQNWIASTPSFSAFKDTSLMEETDSAFAGAEAEYIFTGQRSEIVNQTMMSMCILVIRMLCNIPAVFTNDTAVELMSGAGPFAVLVFIVFWLAETGLDMVFLVNGVSIPLVKIGDMCFLSKKGLKNLTEKTSDLATHYKKGDYFNLIKKKVIGTDNDLKKNEETGKIELVSKGVKKSMENTIKNLIEFDYGEYLWLMLCFVPNKTKVQRIGDLIQMEMNAKDGNNDFKLTEAYTYVRVETTASFRTLIPIPGISDSIPLNTIKYVGY